MVGSKKSRRLVRNVRYELGKSDVNFRGFIFIFSVKLKTLQSNAGWKFWWFTLTCSSTMEMFRKERTVQMPWYKEPHSIILKQIKAL